MEELYDLRSDPDELHNLALDPGSRELLSEYRRRLVAELERTGAALAENLPEPSTARR